jgi:hypothetical protein
VLLRIKQKWREVNGNFGGDEPEVVRALKSIVQRGKEALALLHSTL